MEHCARIKVEVRLFWVLPRLRSSPLPGYYLRKDLAWEAGPNLGVRRHVLDFSTIACQLFHRSWRNTSLPTCRYARAGERMAFLTPVAYGAGLNDRQRRPGPGP